MTTRAARQSRLAKLRRRLARNAIGDRILAAVTRTRGVQGGLPCVRGIPIECLIRPFMAGDSVARVASWFDLPVETVEDVIRWDYYFAADWRVVPVQRRRP